MCGLESRADVRTAAMVSGEGREGERTDIPACGDEEEGKSAM